VESIGSQISGGIESVSGAGISNFAASALLANTQLIGPIAPNPNNSVKLVNCFDGNYTAIANQ